MINHPPPPLPPLTLTIITVTGIAIIAVALTIASKRCLHVIPGSAVGEVHVGWREARREGERKPIRAAEAAR